MTLRDMIGKRVLTMTEDHIRNRSFPIEWRVEELSPNREWVCLRRVDLTPTLENPTGQSGRVWRKVKEFEPTIIEVLEDPTAP